MIVPQVGIGVLDLSTRPSDTPPALPADLVLPLALQVDRLQIGRLRILGWLAQSASLGPSLLEIDDVSARLASDGRHHQLSELRLTAPFATLNGKATLDGTKPFMLDAALRAEGEREAKHFVIDATARGPLDALAVNARASGWNLAGEADLAVTRSPRYRYARQS